MCGFKKLYTIPLNTFLEWSPLECLIYSTNSNPFLAVVLMVKLLDFGVGHCYMHVTLKANFFLSSKNLFSFGGLVWFLFVIKFQPGCYKKHFIIFFLMGVFILLQPVETEGACR